MILSAMEVHSFAALADLRLELQAGMNVILGPNEAGKTTLFRALQHLLLTPTKLNKRSFQEQIRPLLPLGGGDTIHAVLEFLQGKDSYRLEKHWGARASAELSLSDGSRIRDAQAAEKRLQELLPSQPGTLKNVLLTCQAGLSDTLQALEQDEDTLHGLSDLLHRSVLETDGVSVGRFQQLLAERAQALLRHWDPERQQPEPKRSGESRWAQTGEILETYYALEDARGRFREALDKEGALGASTSQLDECVKELEKRERELREIEPAARDAATRTRLEGELQQQRRSLAEARETYDTWTRSLLRREQLDGELPRLHEAVRTLEAELEALQAYERGKTRLDRFRRVERRKAALEAAEAELARLQPLPASRLEQLRRSAAEIARLEAALQAGNLSLTFRARKATELTARTDAGQPSEERLPEHGTFTVRAAGRIEITHPDWELQVSSGERGSDNNSETLQQARSGFQALLQKFQVSSLEEAAQASQRYERARSEQEAAKAVYREELGGDTFQALEESCPDSGQPVPSREQEQVLQELIDKRSALQSLQADEGTIRDLLQKLREKHGSTEALFARIAELGAGEKRLTESLNALAALPAGFREARALVDHYEGLLQDVQSRKQEKIRLEGEVRLAEAALAEESSEEAHRRVEDLQERFQNLLQKAAVLQRIQAKTRALLSDLDLSVYDPFSGLVSRYLAALSGNRYSRVPSRSALPSAAVRGDGTPLPYALLSAGTRDIFALSLRLAMAEFFLGERRGFLVLDDPLVELDPERQKLAATVLERFAETHQLLIFTCQPAHADLLGGLHRIELERA